MISNPNIKDSASFFTVALGMGLVLIFSGSYAAHGQQSVSSRPGVHVENGRRATDKKLDAEKAFEQFAATFEDLYRIASEITSEKPENAAKQRFSLNYVVSMKPNGATSFTSKPPPGQEAAEWSGRYREPLMRLYDAFLPRTEDWNDNLFVQFEVGPEDVSLKATVVMDPESGLLALPGLDQSALVQKAAKAGYVRSQIYGASKVTLRKNKVIIVANLPRAGLESLLIKNEK